MENIRDARHLWPSSILGIFNREARFQGAIFESAELKKLAESYDPETGAYDELQKAEHGLGRFVSVRNGEISYFQCPFDSLKLTDPLYAPHRQGASYITEWHRLLDEFTAIVHPVFKSEFSVRLYTRAHPKAGFHIDKDKIAAILPLGKNQPSTIWKNKDSEILSPAPNSLFINTPDIIHSSAPTLGKRAVLMAYAKY